MIFATPIGVVSMQAPAPTCCDMSNSSQPPPLSKENSIEKKIAQLGYRLPQLNPPLAAYIPARRQGEFIFVSGQLPFQSGELMMTGVMTTARDIEEAQRAMACCFLNGLAAAAPAASGLDNIKGVFRLGAYVASDSNFAEQHLIANGASQLALQIFAEPGRHVRTAIGVPSLPLNATVELEITFLC